MSPHPSGAIAAFLALCTTPFAMAAGGVKVTEGPESVRVEIGGNLFTEYVFKGASHLYFHPVIGPGGAKMTRSYPMQDVPGEEHDHYHHRSLWFAHGAVNGVDYWTEAAANPSREDKYGRIVHDKFLELKSGDQEGVIKSSSKWKARDGSVPLTAVQTFRVYNRPDNERLFDFEITLTAGDKEVVLGDTKEGTMAMRIAESMRVFQAKKKPGEGHIVSSEGLQDSKVWGTRAAWVDYYGPVEGRTLGIAIFDHPSNLRHPTRWHVREYGLFAANPIAEGAMDKSKSKDAGNVTLAPGRSLTLRYRFYIHEGDTTAAKVADRYADYAKTK